MEESLIRIVNEILDEADKDQIKEYNPELKLQDDLLLDSIELAELTVNIQVEFGKDVFKDGVVSTLGEIMDILNAG